MQSLNKIQRIIILMKSSFQAQQSRVRIYGSAPFDLSHLARIRRNKNLKVNPAHQLIQQSRFWIQSSHQARHPDDVLGTSVAIQKPEKQKLQVNPQITSSNFFVKVLAPPAHPFRSIQKTRKTDKASSKGSASSRTRRRVHESLSVEESHHVQQMKNLMSFLDQHKSLQRLNKFSKQKGKNSIRIYKEDIRKIFEQRYGKDRLTTFLDTEYIEDFDSVMKTMANLLAMKREEMMVFVFLLMDINKDGLITPEDLTSFLGAKRDCEINQLFMEDFHIIYSFVNEMKESGKTLFQSPVHAVVFKDQSLTLMKYRLYNNRKQKQRGNGERKKVIMSCRMHQHLFSLQKEKQNNDALRFSLKDILSFVKEKNSRKSNIDKNFAINFETFQKIFHRQVPYTFIDFLYTYGGLEVPGLRYTQVDLRPLQPPSQAKQKRVQQDRLQVVLERIRKMKQFNATTRSFRYKTQ